MSNDQKNRELPESRPNLHPPEMSSVGGIRLLVQVPSVTPRPTAGILLSTTTGGTPGAAGLGGHHSFAFRPLPAVTPPRLESKIVSRRRKATTPRARRRLLYLRTLTHDPVVSSPSLHSFRFQA